MFQYIDFLNRLGTYGDALLVEREIQYYQHAMIINRKEKEVYKNLGKNFHFSQQRKREILKNWTMENLKNSILMDQNLFFNYILENKKELETLYFSIIRNRNIPIYAILEGVVKLDIHFLEMYDFVITNDLYNPNLQYGTSAEPFYYLLPLNPLESFYRLNQMVVKNPKTDFHILCNGSDIIEKALYFLTESENEIVKNYWKEYIMGAVMGNCSLLDSKRYNGVLNYNIKPSIYIVMNHPKLELVHTYLQSEKGVEKQLENSLYPSLERNNAIDFYIENINNPKLQERLKLLKKVV